MGSCSSGCYPHRQKPGAVRQKAEELELIHDWTDQLQAICPSAVVPLAAREDSVWDDNSPSFPNGFLNAMWPFLSQYVVDLVFSVVEPAIQKHTGQHFRIDRDSNFGGKPIHFDAASINRTVQRTAEGEICNLVCNAMVDWVADLTLNVHVGGAPLGVQSFSIKGCLIIELVGMLPRPPMFQGIRVFFSVPPEIDLTFKGGLRSMCHFKAFKHCAVSAIVGALAGAIVVPNRVGSEFSSEFDYFRVVLPRPKGMVKLTVWNARDIPAADITGTSDPYVVVRCGAERFRSRTKWRTMKPDFLFHACVMFFSVRHQKVRIELWDADRLTPDTLLGHVDLDLSTILEWGTEKQLLLLSSDGKQNGTAGSVLVSAEFRRLLQDQTQVHTDNLAQVFAGLYSGSHMPAGENGTVFWVEAQCSNLFHEEGDSGPEPPQMTSRREPTDVSNDLSTDKLAGIMSKITLCQKYNMSTEDMAHLLDLHSEHLDSLMRPPTERTSSGSNIPSSGEVLWNHAFQFLVQGAENATMTFVLKCLPPKLPGRKSHMASHHAPTERTLGTYHFSVGELLKTASTTAVQTLRLQPDPSITLKLRVQVRFLGCPLERDNLRGMESVASQRVPKVLLKQQSGMT